MSTTGSIASLNSAKTEPQSNTSSRRSGVITAEVLSVYDLPTAEPPLAVTIEAVKPIRSTNGNSTALLGTAQTGPPLAKHKDRNSFRFSAPNRSATPGLTNPSQVEIRARLADLYLSTLTVTVQYKNSSKTLVTTYTTNHLKIHETKWLILTLSHKPESNGNGGTADTSLIMSADDSSDEIAPTIRLKLTMMGPYRPEIALLVDLTQGWFGLVDDAMDAAGKVVQSLPLPSASTAPWLVLPAVPLLGGLVVVSPILIGLAVVCLPFLLPLLVLAMGVGAAALALGGTLYFSTKSGRGTMGILLGPLLESVASSKAGQRLIYETGPRPTPVSLARIVLPTTTKDSSLASKLVVSLLIDLMGSASYLVPVVGEAFDLVWAPIQTICIMAMYEQEDYGSESTTGATTPALLSSLKYLSFLEEILPFTDIVPTATLGVLVEFTPKLFMKKDEQDIADNDRVDQIIAAAPTPLNTPVRGGVPSNPYR